MAELRAGDVIDQRYRIARSIGAGGMASVFEVQDITTGARHAMKVLHRQLLLHPVIPQRFLVEAQAASALTTPFAVKVESTGNLPSGAPYIVMEYLEGQPLNAVIQREAGRFDAERVLYLADQVAQGLGDAHARGIIHRDLKPENIFVLPTRTGELVKVVDFGISKIFSGEDGVKLTQTGVTVGTPQYMPVEQLRGTKDLDARVDVYALGVVMYEMFAGVRPYDGFTYEEVILKVATSTAPPLATYRSDLPPALLRLVDRTMARDRNERVGSMVQLRQEMAPFWSGRSPLAPAATLNEVSAADVLSATGSHPPATQPVAPTSHQTPMAPAVSQTPMPGAVQPGLPHTGKPQMSPSRPSAGRTQVIEDPARSPVVHPPPARTIPDHEVVSLPVPATQPAKAPQSGPPKTLVLLLAIVAAGLFGLILVVGAVALWLYL